MDLDQITVLVRYHRLDFYGKSAEVPIIVSPKAPLGELKDRIALKLKISPEHQSLTLKQVNKITPLEDVSASVESLGIK